MSRAAIVCDCPSFRADVCQRLRLRIDAEDYDPERDGVCECLCHHTEQESH